MHWYWQSQLSSLIVRSSPVLETVLMAEIGTSKRAGLRRPHSAHPPAVPQARRVARKQRIRSCRLANDSCPAPLMLIPRPRRRLDPAPQRPSGPFPHRRGSTRRMRRSGGAPRRHQRSAGGVPCAERRVRHWTSLQQHQTNAGTYQRRHADEPPTWTYSRHAVRIWKC